MADLRKLANHWRSMLVDDDLETRSTLTRRWLQMESALEDSMAAYSYAPASERPGRGAWLMQQAQSRLTGLLPTLRQSIMAGGVRFASMGQGAGQDFLQAQGVYARRDYSPPGWDAQWESSLDKTADLAIAGLVAAMMQPQGTIEAVRALRAGFGKGFGQALMIARDYPMREFRTQMTAFGFDDGWVRLSARANTTCLACILLDGTIYDDPSKFIDHPWGMCFLVPMADATQMPDAGMAWFLALSPDRQREIMGAEYYAAWKAGKFGLMDILLLTAAGYVVVKSLKALSDEGYDEG